MVLAAGTAPLPAAPGASAFFVSGDPVIVEARGLYAAGELARAEALLRGVGDTVHADAAAEGLELIRRMRREYSQTPEQLLAKLRESIPDVTAADLERWREAGQVQTRVIDGQVAYFRREPSNIFRFCDEARRRRDAHAASRPAKAPGPDRAAEIREHTQAALAAAKESGRTEVLPIRHRIKYSVTLPPNRAGARAGSIVRCWLPLPQVYRQQGSVQLIRTSPAATLVAPSASEEGGALQRTVYFETTIEDPAKPLRFEEEFTYVCSAYVPELRDELARPGFPEAIRPFVAERLPHIALTPEMRETAERIVGSEQNPLARARRIFEFVDREIRYCAEEEYCVIPSFSLKALTQRRGDCGVQGMLFITLCRAAGVPARWQSGWQTKPGAWNMHDWAEFYVEPWGWLPADASNGLQASDDPDVRYFFFGHMDSYRMIVNLDYGMPLQPPKTSLRSEPADFQRGEVEIDGRNLYYDEWDYAIEIQWEPLS